MATSKETFYPESKFGGFTDIDGTVVFFTRVNALLQPDSVVLDVGCGRGEYADDPIEIRKNLRVMRDKVAKVIGIDVDPNASENPCVDEFHLIESDVWPVEDNSVDVVICDFVIEHIADPNQIFSEFARVLKPGGALCIRTVNRWGYVALAASLIPNKFHSMVTNVVQEGREEEDVFPTLYRCNSTGKLRAHMRRFGFESVVYGYGAEPAYLAFSKIAYFFGVLHQRLFPKFLQPTMFAFGRLKQ